MTAGIDADARQIHAHDEAITQQDPQTLEALKRFLQQHIPAAAAQPVSAQTQLLASGLLDSLGILHLVAFLAEELGVEIGDEDFSEENFATVGALLALVARKRSAGNDSAPSA
ncbi:MAG: hypothetical protein CTY15_09960 [Methylocystis sp.]|nr:MAG: hypothetical protein CTY15_09960 [Methylocystis sp.]